VTLLYFAWVRQKIGVGEERISLPDDVRTVEALLDLLRARGPGYADAFADPARLRAARNQVHVTFDAEVTDEDEIAFFPPVTGG
jgi:molybdopterin synthase sulfur carrier subunit